MTNAIAKIMICHSQGQIFECIKSDICNYVYLLQAKMAFLTNAIG